jgi:hypothetical protein
MAAQAALIPDPTEKPPRRRRAIPLSLRIFAGILLMLGIGALWVAVRGYRQDAAIRQLEQSGWAVLTRPRGPEWLHRHCSHDTSKYLCSVEWVSARRGPTGIVASIFRHETLSRQKRRQLSDAELACLSKLIEPEELDLSCTSVSDAELAHLARLTTLKRLCLDYTPVTDTGLSYLSHLTHLEELQLDGTHVTGPGLKYLGRLISLESLELDHAPVNDAGLAELPELPRLRSLSLEHTSVSDAGLIHLQKLPCLEDLRLDHTRVTDDGLRDLTRLSGLLVLDLSFTDVTDGAIVYLKQMTSIREFWLFNDNPKMTEAGLAELRRALPNAEILR